MESNKKHQTDLYQILDLKRNCSQDEIRSQYKKLALVSNKRPLAHYFR